ncbi:MAG: LuxR C-terminal-related transcriptional regulator [Anaerolineae bacterium]|nr:LuxR C-terminal-related transcriptional regulator [Anaerolineae bacterium]
MTIPLLATKCFSPTLPMDWVSRTRLLRGMDDLLLPGKKLLLVSAPPGYGKTSLAAEWLNLSRPNPTLKYTWLSLDEADNDLQRFLVYLFFAIQKLYPDLGIAEILALQSAQPPASETVLTHLINQLSIQNESLVFVLDDYHLIKNEAVHQNIQFLLDHLPPQMRLLILSRSDPPLPLGRLRARGQLLELHAAELKFALDETAQLVNERQALNLNSQDLERLALRTEGWIAGLQLAVLSMRGREDASEFIRDFSGSHTYILDYLTEEVLAHQPAEQREFLLQTCILERLNAPLCDYLTGSGDSQSRLLSLLHGNLFIVPLDEKQVWFRYHHLFADLLRAQLEHFSPGRAQALHSRASRWFAENGYLSEAITHALAAAELDRAVQLIEENAMQRLMQGELNQMKSWLNLLPPETFQTHVWLNIYAAWINLLSGLLDKAAENLVQAQAALSDTAPQYQTLLGHFAIIRAYLAAMHGDPQQTQMEVNQALAHLPPEEERILCVGYFVLGIVKLRGNDLQGAASEMKRASHMARVSSNVHLAVPAACGLAGLQLVLGQLHQAQATLSQAQQMTLTPSGKPTHLYGRVCSGWSLLCYRWNDAQRAESYARQGIELTRQWGHMEALFWNYMALVRVLTGTGRLEEALETLHKASNLAEHHDFTPDAPAAVQACRVQIWLKQGQPGLELAAHWLQEADFSKKPLPGIADREIWLAAVAVCLVQNQTDAAQRLVNTLYNMSGVKQMPGIYAEILLFQTLIDETNGQKETALQHLHTLLTLVQPEGFIRLFVDAGRSVQFLLITLQGRLTKEPVLEVYVKDLLAAYPVENNTSPAAPTAVPGVFEALSEREMEVLRLIAAGESNASISERLFIALSTTKRHVNHILDKLGASSRTQAIARARELGLL